MRVLHLPDATHIRETNPLMVWGLVSLMQPDQGGDVCSRSVPLLVLLSAMLIQGCCNVGATGTVDGTSAAFCPLKFYRLLLCADAVPAGRSHRHPCAGAGLGRRDAAIIFEELAWGCVPTAAFLSIHNMVAAGVVATRAHAPRAVRPGLNRACTGAYRGLLMLRPARRNTRLDPHPCGCTHWCRSD